MNEQTLIDQALCRRILDNPHKHGWKTRHRVGDLVDDLEVIADNGQRKTVTGTVTQSHLDAVDVFIANYPLGTENSGTVNFRIAPADGK